MMPKTTKGRLETGPTFDADGYPTEETLQRIADWRSMSDRSHAELMEFVRQSWRYPDYFSVERGEYHLSTGGWSGNEDIIQALRSNTVFWIMCWWSSARGGHYVFHVRSSTLDSLSDSAKEGVAC